MDTQHNRPLIHQDLQIAVEKSLRDAATVSHRMLVELLNANAKNASLEAKVAELEKAAAMKSVKPSET